MFNTLTNGQIETLFEQFSLPMFITERRGAGTGFAMVGLNGAVKQLVSQPRKAIVGQSVTDMAITGEGNDTGHYFLQCATSRSAVRFICVFEHDDNKQRWDMNLQYGQSPEGHDRIIATANPLAPEPSILQDKIAFDDVSYFSSMADLQLENLSNAFSSVAQQIPSTMIQEDRIMQLHAVCRTIQSSVSDIKYIVKRAQARHSKLQDQNQSQDKSSEIDRADCMDTVRALSDTWMER